MEITDDGGFCGVEGGGVGGGPNHGGGQVRSEADQQMRERDYRWYRRRGTDRSGRERQRIFQQAVLDEAAEVVVGAATATATETETTNMTGGEW